MKSQVGALELKVLCEIARIIGQAHDLDRTLESVLRILSETLSMKRATLTLLDETGQLSIRASYGLTAEERQRGVYRLDEGVTGHIFQTAKPFIVPDVSKEPLFLDKTRSRSLERGRISFIGVPIRIKGQPAGVLNVDRLFEDEVSFEEDVNFLSVVSTLISQFIQLSRHFEERELTLKKEISLLRSKLSASYQRFFIVGKSQPMERVRQMIEKVSPTKATVLLLGESGTGKTLTARIIHELSERHAQPFIKVNCAALPETLLESELFGHEKGAFTGATAPKPGRFEEADGGTIFLDEIGELTLAVQSKLLRVIQEKEFERLGATKTRRVDVRIIAATNKDLAEEVRRGQFREDLFYRLNVFPIRVPALRERPEDIPALLNHFLETMEKEYSRRLVFTPKALDSLMRYDWPGNVREMENLVERLSIMVEGEQIDVEDIPSQFFIGARPPASPEEHASLVDIEKREVLSALERHRWIQSRAAKELGITLRQMGYRIKKFSLEALVQERRSRIRGDK
ncbi:transcriptional regulator, NifA subfamily, Fis Family [Desulfovibrio sp. X2]|uniref:sigma-54-dependent Fis family transcriptional regulator n=1 Tax=Desulfovibrio sp. X2 TaxID=941449 RepID=UPI0003589C68|nr:sigma-54-dependent Fis family transcriptional regulator [Desulfovibrio sp. X2]EPR43907.1 transcriptional regulator, NifA subfamily, Fis Family [Desulfovibrio sp. X2]